MAKKKKNENTLQYLQMPLPSGGKYSKMTKVAFGGLNNRYTIDSGEMSMEHNISTKEYPYLTPSEKRTDYLDGSGYEKPISMFAFDNFLLVVYGENLATDGTENYAIKVDYIYNDSFRTKHTGVIKSEGATEDELTPRSIVQFNVYDTPTDPLTGQYVKKLLCFPDKVSMYMNIVEADSSPKAWVDDWVATEDDKKSETALANADLGVMYYYDYDDDGRRYFTVSLEKCVEGDDGYDKNKVTYKRVVNTKYKTENKTLINEFFCDGMEVVVKEYTNNTPEVDASGAIIYPPPDTASHNCYYRNSADNDIYRWCEYETVKREEEWGLKKDKDGKPMTDDNGNYIIEGFIKDGENYVKDGGTEYGWKVSIPPAVPSLKHVTVHLSRVFGVDDDRVYASGYNDYANWNLDTVGEYNEANSWCSPSQSNTKAGGKFTGITTFQNHVICFKHDFMHEIYNTKNPFRIQDIYAEGAIDNRTIQDVDGKLIFVSEDDVKVYTGSNPRIIGYNLNMPKYGYAVSGTDNRNYYLYCEDDNGIGHLYVYDTYTDMWSEQELEYDPKTEKYIRVISFAHNKNGMYMLCEDGHVYRMDTNNYTDQEWSFETDLVTNKTVDIKHIKKLQMYVEHKESTEENPVYMQVYILYDDEVFDNLSDEEMKKRLVYDTQSRDRYGKYPIRVKPRKTANYGFKLHVEGKGYVKLYELEIFVEQGGDLYV